MRVLFVFAIFSAFTLHGKTSWCQPFQYPEGNKFSASQPYAGEKIYIHTDKDFYIAGETIWFRVFCVDQNFKPTSLSTLAYVELLDAAGVSLTHTKIDLLNSNDHGSFRLPLSIANGNYILRGYTNLMRNTGSLFEKQVTIINTLKKFEAPKSPKGELKFGFFPEGGSLVAGLESRVYFKLADVMGKGIDFHGVVLKGSDTATRFSSLRNGMGQFRFQPERNVQYTAQIFLSDGTSFTQQLPEVENRGYVMKTDKIDNHHIHLVVKSSDKNQITQNIKLVISNTKQKAITREIEILQGIADAVVDVSGLGAGIVRLALYDAYGKMLGESLKFIRPDYQTGIVIKSDHEVFDSRSKVNILIQPSDTSQFKNGADISVSVHLLDSLDQDNNTGISSGLWFDGHLRGMIESPEYYFDSSNADVEDVTDNLLMTQGYNSIDRVIKQRSADFTPELNGHLVTALITHERTGQPGRNKLAFLSIPGKHFGFYAAESDSNGIARFEIRNEEGPLEMIFQTQLMDSMYRIRLLGSYSENVSKNETDAINVSLNESDLKMRSIAMQTQLVYPGYEETFVSSLVADTLPFFGKPQATYFLDDYKKFTTMEEVLREYVREVNVAIHEGKPVLRMYNKQLMDFFYEGILVLIDGVPLADPNKIFLIDPLTIKKLDIISQSYILGPAVFSAILSFTTAEGNAPGLRDLYPSLVRMDYEGTQLHREFHSPVYETVQSRESRIPDFRSTLYWNPHLKVKNGTASFDFYTSDMKGRYLVKVEGIDSNGLPIEESSVIKVR